MPIAKHKCKYCGIEPSTDMAGCNASLDGTHFFNMVMEGAHHHTLTLGPRKPKDDCSTVWSGGDGWRCQEHSRNSHPTCRACRYANYQGGLNHQWMLENPGAHTCAIPLDVPADWDGKLSKDPMKNQVGGQHYQQMGITPFAYALANNLNALEFSIVKYLRKKGDKAKRIEDLQKLVDCAEKLIAWEKDDGKV